MEIKLLIEAGKVSNVDDHVIIIKLLDYIFNI
jgi:hypothetical protein